MNEKQKNKIASTSGTFISLGAIIGLVVLNILNENVDFFVNLGLIGAILGANIEDVRRWFQK